MGKVVKFTGSKLLGAELRRLRGGRSLKQIAQLSRTPPLAERVAPVSAPTLSQVENGISFPSLETLHSLALIYRTSVQQLLDLVVQERMLGSGSSPESQEAARQLFAEAVIEGNWHEALRLAIWGERESRGREALSWRANRAKCLARLGMISDAVDLLEACLADPQLKVEARYQLHLSIAEAQSLAGHSPTARLHVQAAEATAPKELPPSEQLRVLRTVAYVLLQAEDPVCAEQDARRAMRLLEKALRLADHAEPTDKLLIRTHLAFAIARAGNRLAAVNDLDRVLQEARAEGAERAVVECLVILGTLRREQGQTGKALSLLDEAATLAVDAGEANLAFEACYQAYLAVEGRDGRKAAYYLARCERFHPLLQARTSSVQRFELAAWGEA